MTAGVSTHIEGKIEKTYGLKGKRMRTHAGLKNVWEKCASPFACKLSEILLSSTMQCLERKPLHCLSWIYKKNPMGGQAFSYRLFGENN